MEEEKEKKKYETCSTCKAKIGFFRRRAAKRMDASGKYPITQSQFCSPKCAKIGYMILLEMQDIKQRERDRASRIIDISLNKIAKNRAEMIRQYGTIDRIPFARLPLLYSGAYKLLETIKEQIQYGHKKEESKRRS